MRITKTEITGFTPYLLQIRVEGDEEHSALLACFSACLTNGNFAPKTTMMARELLETIRKEGNTDLRYELHKEEK